MGRPESFGIHLSHSTERMESHLRQNPEVGTEILNLAEGKTGDIIFIGPKQGSLGCVGMVEFDEDSRLGLRHCRG